MSETSRCPECGAELPADALGGLCPKCLLAAGLESHVAAGVAAGSGPEAPTTPHSGSFIPPDTTWLAAHFPQLEILELLGHGGMGAVYKARQPKLDRLVALKIIRPESAHDPAFAERFNREARMLARLAHPNIVAVYDFGEVNLSAAGTGANDQQLYFFLMEYVDGMNLRQLLQTGELLPEQALAIVPQICEALQFAHSEGVVHRDIKPENILLDKRGRVKIADFGLAKLAASSPQDFTLTGTHQVMGTPRYMAPEQMEGSHAVDHRADIYSLGVVFYEMLTGELPMGHFEPPSKKVDVDVRLDEVVLRTLARNPERRYQYISEVKSQLESISKSPRPVQSFGQHRESATDDREIASARQQVQFPVIGLLVCGILTVPLAARAFFSRHGDRLLTENPLQFVVWLALFLPPLALIVGAVKMLQLTSYRWAIAASLLVMVSPAALEQRQIWWLWWLCVVVGIWSLVVLSKPEVRRAFAIWNRRDYAPAEVNATNAQSQSPSKPTSEVARFVANPAWGLIITGIISWITIPLAFAVPFNENMNAMNATQRTVFQISFGAIPLVVGTIMALAGFRMKRLEGYRLATFAAALPIVVLLFKLVGLSFGTLAIGPADLVGAPIGLWVLVVLSRSDVKAVFHRASPERASAPPAARGTLGQAWDQWWARRDRWLTSTVLAVLLVVHIGCLAMFLTLRGGGGYDSGRPSAWHHVGWPTPWFVYERGVEPNVAFRRTINLLSSSVLIAGIGMLAWYAFWRIQRVRDARNARFWRTIGSPTAVSILWILAGAAFAMLGVRDAKRLYESMPTEKALADVQRAPEFLTEARSLEPASNGEAEPATPITENAPEIEKFYALGQRAQEAFDGGDFKAAKSLAQEYLQLAGKYRDDWNYGNAIHDANSLLGRVAVVEGNLAAAKEHLLAAGKTTGSPQLASFGPNLALPAQLLARGENDAVVRYLSQMAAVWRSTEKITRLVTTIQQGETPPELNVVPDSHPLIATWSSQGTGPENTADRHVVQFNADGKGSLGIVREEMQHYRVADSELIVTDPATGKEEKVRYEFRDAQLVLFTPPDGPLAADEIVFGRIGSVAAADSLVGTWEGTLQMEDVGSATITQTFDSEEAGQTTLQVRLSKPISFFFSVIGDKLLWALDADSAASPAEWSIADDQLTLKDFFMDFGETPNVYRREK